MLLDDVPYGRQPDPGAGDAPNHVAGPMKLFKQVGQIARRYANTEIAHGHHGRIVLSPDADRHIAPVRAVLDGVTDQICQHPLEALRIPVADELGCAWPDRKRCGISVSID